MTAKQLYEYLLIEQNKREAPSVLLNDFNYFANRAINQYVNKRYALYEKDQQSTDDLDAIRKLDHPITLTLQGTRYKGTLPTDFLHPLNCSVKFNVINTVGCYTAGGTITFRASKLTSDNAKTVEENYYFKPSYKNPYFYRNTTLLEIRSGNTTDIRPDIAYIDYLKKPTIILLTQDQIDSIISDTSQILEFPDNVAQEILLELTNILLENTSDPRLQSHIPIGTSIGLQQNNR